MNPAIDKIKPADLEKVLFRIEDCLTSAKSELAKRLLYRASLQINKIKYKQPRVINWFVGLFNGGNYETK